MKRRILSMLLAMLMVLTLVPSSAFAAGVEEDYTQWKQADEKWNNAEAWPASEYPNAKYHYMHEAGCYVTTIAMLLRHYDVVTDTNVNDFNPWICNIALGKAGALDSKADMIPANIKNAYPGFVYAGSVEYSDSNLVSLFNQGYACVVKVQNGENEHFVAVKTATDVDNIEIMDPGPDNTSLSHYGGGLEIIYFSVTPNKVSRYTVLALDTSGSMSGTPAQKQKVAAIKFCESVLAADGINNVAIVKINSTSSLACEFTNDLSVLKDYINGLDAYGGTNINQALEVAGQLLDEIPDSDKTIKNIVLCSDGLPQRGSTITEGRYTSSDYSGYNYANYCYNTAVALKEKNYIYTLGFFHSLSSSELSFASKFMDDLQNAGYYEVTDPENLEFTFGDIADDITKPRSGEFWYVSNLVKGQGIARAETYSYTYDESWFKEDSTVFNHDLAKMSIRMTMAGCASSYRDKALYIKNLLNDLKFNNIVAEYPTPTRDSIGYTLAYKTLADGSVLVSVVIRSGGYGAEWASNFTIGLTNEHQGFDDAAKQVVAGIEEYIANNDEITGNVKFWITGYSRGAATANLVAQKLDAKAIYSKNSIYEKSNIYAYCFECPRNMIKDKDDSYYAQFNNIFNIVNYADIVTKVAMPDWGYTRYGIDMNIPSPENTSGYKAAYEKMLKEYKKIAAKVDNPSMTADEAAKLMKNQGSFTDKISAALSSYFDSQGVYVVAYQDDMRDLLAKTLGSEDIGIETVLSTILNMGVFPILHPYITLKAASNLSEIGQAHYPELCLAWVDAIAAENSFASNKIRQIHINCPVDVSVYDSNGTLVAQIINDEPVDIEGSYISAFVDENGQKVIVLPTDEEYRLELTATDNGTVSYQVVELDTSSYIVERLVNYYDVEIKTGDVLVAGAEKTSDGATAVYTLGRQGEGTVTSIEPTSNETGDVARIKLTVSAEEGGTASGGGIFNKGEFAKVTATADENSVFEGWYAGNEKVSDEAEYRFRMENDTDLIAKFHTHDYKNGKCECGAKDPDYKPPMPVHVHRYTETVTEPTCTEKGYTTYTCICGRSYVDNYVDALGHTEVVDPAVAATCEKTGLTEGKHCSVCNEVLVAQKETPKTGHKFENGKCSVCGAADPNYVAPVVNPFKDVKEGDAFYDEILWAADKGIIKGDGTGNYNPNDGITRAQIVMILWNAAGNKEASKPSGFADVKDGAWYAKAVAWAVENGITNGTDLGFEPDRVCTRAEIVTFLHRANNKPAPAAAASFTDLTQDWYKDAVAWAVENGITKGVGDNRFAPNDTCTRGQAAAFMYRLAQLAK